MSSRVLFEGRSVTASRPRYAQVWVVWASIVRSSAPSVICTLRGFADSAPRDSQREDPVSRSDWRSPPGPEADMSAGPTDKQRGAPLRRLPSCRRTWWFAYARTGVWRRPRAPCIRRSASVGARDPWLIPNGGRAVVVRARCWVWGTSLDLLSRWPTRRGTHRGWRSALRHVLHGTFMRIAVFARGLEAGCAIVMGGM